MRSTPYVREFYLTTASFRKAKSSFSSAVDSSVSQPSPVPTTFSATSSLHSIISSIRSNRRSRHHAEPSDWIYSGRFHGPGRVRSRVPWTGGEAARDSHIGLDLAGRPGAAASMTRLAEPFRHSGDNTGRDRRRRAFGRTMRDDGGAGRAECPRRPQASPASGERPRPLSEGRAARSLKTALGGLLPPGQPRSRDLGVRVRAGGEEHWAERRIGPQPALWKRSPGGRPFFPHAGAAKARRSAGSRGVRSRTGTQTPRSRRRGTPGSADEAAGAGPVGTDAATGVDVPSHALPCRQDCGGGAVPLAGRGLIFPEGPRALTRVGSAWNRPAGRSRTLVRVKLICAPRQESSRGRR